MGPQGKREEGRLDAGKAEKTMSTIFLNTPRNFISPCNGSCFPCLKYSSTLTFLTNAYVAFKILITYHLLFATFFVACP